MRHRILSGALALGVLACAPGRGSPVVRPGIDVLLSDSAALIAGRRVGLLTNQAGVDRNGTGDLERLLAAGAQVTAIFSPEHGYRGLLDTPGIAHGVDSATGIPIYSLYGDTRQPTAEMLEQVEVLLVDLQDIGGRPYTYASTALLAMQAAGRQGVTVVVLDRPNPVGGALVQGPVLDTAFAAFVGLLPVALRHGMTLGELTLLGNEALRLGARLTVVPAAGWTRAAWLDETGLPWVRPSPSMPTLESAAHYSGLVLFEGTNLSVGRGTPIAFQVVGAPWLDAGSVVRALGAPTGVAATDTVLIPEAPPDGKYDGVPLPSVRLRVTERTAYDPTSVAISLLVAIRTVHGDSLRIDPERFDRLAGSDAVRRAVEAGARAEEIVAGWQPPLRAFLEVRRRFLLYR